MSSNLITADNGVSSGVTGITQSAGSDGTLQLRTTTSGGTATTALTIDNSQKVTFANSIGFGSNAGITFNNSSALTNSTLNDYETGTFTPALNFTSVNTGVTYGSQQGTYVKIGRLVVVDIYIALTSKGSASGNCNITGLPFANVNSSANYPGGAFRLGNNALTSLQGAAQFYLPYNSTDLALEYMSSGTAVNLPATGFNNTTDICLNFSYYAQF